MSKNFARNLRAYRAMANMTQTDLAKACEITRAAVNNYELGRSEPSFENLCKMAAALGVDIADLLSDKPSTPDYVRMAQVTDEESALLQLFREADPVYRGVAMDILRAHKEEK